MEQTVAKVLQFFHLNPGMGLFILACAMTVGRKYAKHKSGKASYTLADLKKYPGEALELALIVLAILLSIYFFAMG